MAALAFIFVIWIAASVLSKKQKADKASAQKRFTQPANPGVSGAAAPETIFPDILKEGDSVSDGECLGGSLPHTEHQGDSVSDGVCVGGSLPHETHEGGEETIRISVQAFEEPTGQFRNVSEMRKAVIMSEILAKPVSLRKNGRSF